MSLSAGQEYHLLCDEYFTRRLGRPTACCATVVVRGAGRATDIAIDTALKAISEAHPVLTSSLGQSGTCTPDERWDIVSRGAIDRVCGTGLYAQALNVGGDGPVELRRRRVEGASASTEGVVRSVLLEEHATLFDYAQPPLLRGTLVSTPSDGWYLFVSCPHVVCDLASRRVIENDLLTALCSGGLERQGGRRARGNEVGVIEDPKRAVGREESTAYWRRVWSELEPHQLLAADMSAIIPPVFGPRFGPMPVALETREVNEAGLAQLERVGLKSRTEITATLLLMFAIVQHLFSGRTRLAIWYTFDNRPADSTAQTVGAFETVHAIDVDLRGNRTVGELFALTLEKYIEAVSHAEVPLVAVWNTSERRRDTWPLFVLASHARRGGISRSPGLQALRLPHVTRCSAHCCVDLELRETSSTVTTSYPTETFDRRAMERFTSLFASGLAGIATLPSGFATPVRVLETMLLNGHWRVADSHSRSSPT